MINGRHIMKFNLFSDNKKTVNIIMLIGSGLICIGTILPVVSIAENHSLWLFGLGSIVIFWSVFSYTFVKAKETDLKPSKVLSNISFLVLTTFWSIFLVWIYTITL